MGKSTTEQKATSQDRGIIQEIGFKEFTAICQEYQIVEKATKNLLTIANDTETPIRTRVDIYKWAIEMNIGKPKQMEDINLLSEDNTPNINIVEYISEDNVVSTLINKVGGLGNIIQILRDRGYKDIPDIKEFAKSEDQLNV